MTDTDLIDLLLWPLLELLSSCQTVLRRAHPLDSHPVARIIDLASQLELAITDHWAEQARAEPALPDPPTESPSDELPIDDDIPW